MAEITLEIVRTLVLLGIVVLLLIAGRNRFELRRKGWNLIVGGFGLLLFGSLVDITDNFETLNRFVVIGDTNIEAILEQYIGFLGGFAVLAIGLIQWLPGVQRLSDETAERLRAGQTFRAVHGTPEYRAQETYADHEKEIARRNRLETLLTANAGQLEVILENLDQGVSLIDGDLKVLAFNQRFLELLEFPSEGFRPGDNFEKFIRYNAERGEYGPGDVETQVRERVALAKRFEPHRFERVRPDGVAIEVRGKPIPGGGGFVTTYTDTTHRRQAEETLHSSKRELQAHVADLEAAQRKLEWQGEDLVRLAEDLRLARDQAEAGNQAKSEFLAMMSHELRTPLNAIIGFSEIIKDETFGPVGNVKYRGYSEDIHVSGQHLLALINDILDLSKIESGVEELYEENVEILDLAQSVLRLVRQRAQNGGVELELDVGDDLPLLRADERKVKQILVNLLSNAVKFTEPDGKVTLKAWSLARSGFVFQVIDNGVGIASKDIPRALSQFGQIDSDLNRRHEGTGLGLPLTKSLVELHGGSLDLQSQLGVGTTVTIRFPATRIVQVRQAASAQDEAQQSVG